MKLRTRSYPYDTSRSKVFSKKAAIPVVAISAVALLVLLYFQAMWVNFFVLTFRGSILPSLMILGCLGTLFAIFSLRHKYHNSSSIYPPSKDQQTGRKTLQLIVVMVALFIAALVLGAFNGFLGKQQIMDSVSTSTEAMPTYQQRAAFPVARAQAVQSVTDPGSDLGETRYIPEQNRYTGLVSKRGMFTGYSEIISQEVALTGQAKGNACVFSENANQRVGALFANNLKRTALLKAGLDKSFDKDDIYGYCEADGTPKVIWPYTKFKGFFPTYRVPAGVLIYNGKTNEITLRDQVKPGEVFGPVYPSSLSVESREATHASQGIQDYIFSRAGYEDTSDDAGDPNGDNRSEFNLKNAKSSDNEWVTPITLRGASTSIAGVSHVSSNSMTSGQLNPMVINKFAEPRAANSAVLDKLKSDYNHDNLNWADDNLRIWEIAPVSDKEWVASIGYAKNIIARANVKSDLSSCLADGSGKVIRCSNQTEATPTPGQTTTLPGANKKLEQMTPDELAQLQKAVADEMLRRMKTQGQK